MNERPEILGVYPGWKGVSQPCDVCGKLVAVNAVSPSECFCSADCSTKVHKDPLRAIAGTLNIAATRGYLFTFRERMPVFTITDHPSDWPDFYVARLHLCSPEPQPMPFMIMDRDLERLQVTMQALGLVKLARSPQDDPVILETWL